MLCCSVCDFAVLSIQSQGRNCSALRLTKFGAAADGRAGGASLPLSLSHLTLHCSRAPSRSHPDLRKRKFKVQNNLRVEISTTKALEEPSRSSKFHRIFLEFIHGSQSGCRAGKSAAAITKAVAVLRILLGFVFKGKRPGQAHGSALHWLNRSISEHAMSCKGFRSQGQDL